jgi:cysteinyl-tRNA synthetase, unknown class
MKHILLALLSLAAVCLGIGQAEPSTVRNSTALPAPNVRFEVSFSPSPGPRPPVASAPLVPVKRSKPAWKDVRSWAIQTEHMPPRLDRIQHANLDMGIISRQGAHGKTYSREQVLRAKQNKWLLAYVNVGEAQRHEWYFAEVFRNGPPAWVLDRNRRHPVNYRVLLDAPEWQAIVLETINRVIEQGFDGVELDVLDVYWNRVYPGRSSRANQAKAVNLACKIAKFARAQNPNFKVLVNNAADLAGKFPEYRNCVDGTIGESVWWFNTNTLRDKAYTQFQIQFLSENQKAGLKVFVMDKTVIPQHGAFVYRESRKRGWLPFVSDWFLSHFPLEAQTEQTAYGFYLLPRITCSAKDSRDCPLGAEP